MEIVRAIAFFCIKHYCIMLLDAFPNHGNIYLPQNTSILQSDFHLFILHINQV